MADGFTARLESSDLLAALHRLGTTALKYTVPACRESAVSIDAEATRRVKRGATGDTAEGIGTELMHNGEGYVVYSVNRRMPNLPGWLEFGTQKGKPRSHAMPASPHFWPAVRLEEGQHARRISAAIGEAISAEGLGS
jgi:hypothetical protein